MAEDNGTNNNSDAAGNEFIDVDAIEVSVLILAKHPNGQKQAAAFLNKRGWPTTVTGSISEALNILVNKRPDVVLISFNHPHPAIMKLPEVMIQTFNIFCIGYVETADAPSTARLAQAKMLYKLLGYPSGPSIQRLIRRVLEERLGSRAAGGYGPSSKSGGETITTGKYTMETSRVKLKFKDVNSMYGGGKSSPAIPSFLDPAKSQDLLARLKKTLLPESQANLDSEYADAPRPFDIPDAVGRLTNQSFELNGEITHEEDKLQKQALLEQAVEAALIKSFKSKDNVMAKTAPVIYTRRVAVMCVESPVLHGYLVATPSEPLEKNLADDFLKVIKSALEDNFVSLSVPGRIDSGFWVDIPETEFNQWMSTSALFHLKFPLDGKEVGVGYFPTANMQATPKRSAKAPGMYAVELKDISTDFPVNFKAYLPMENGQKPYLYLRNGRTLQPEQKERLLANNIGELCMKGVDVENFKAFAASIFLQSTMKKKSAA